MKITKRLVTITWSIVWRVMLTAMGVGFVIGALLGGIVGAGGGDVESGGFKALLYLFLYLVGIPMAWVYGVWSGLKANGIDAE